MGPTNKSKEPVILYCLINGCKYAIVQPEGSENIQRCLQFELKGEEHG